VKNGEVKEYRITPADFGLPTYDNAAIRVDGAEKSKAMLLDALGDKAGAARDIVALNAGASIYSAGIAASHADGVKQALANIASGAARNKLDQFVAFTKGI